MADRFIVNESDVVRVTEGVPSEEEGGPSTDNGFVDFAIDDMSVYADEPERPEELSHEQKMFVLEDAVIKHPLNREIMYRILAFCEEEKLLRVIEEEIATWPEFGLCTQNQYHMVCTLAKNYGLEFIERDEEGRVVYPEQKEGLTEDEIDDLVWSYNYKTTEVGMDFVRRHAPRARILELMDAKPERASTYIEILEFIDEQPRSYNEVRALLDGRDVLQIELRGHIETMQPSVFVDKLERSGALVWNKGWTLTADGKDYLRELKENQAM